MLLILWNTVKNPAACKQVWKMWLEDVIFSFAPDTSEQAVPRWIEQAVRPDQPSFSLEARDTYATVDEVLHQVNIAPEAPILAHRQRSPVRFYILFTSG